MGENTNIISSIIIKVTAVYTEIHRVVKGFKQFLLFQSF